MNCLFEVNTICRLCLRANEKVFRLNNPHHKAFIESIKKLKQFHYVPTDDEYVCYICNALLRKAFNFIQTVWNAQEIICVLLKNTDIITKPMLEHIDRHNNGLNPINLSSVTICEKAKNDSSDDSNASTDIGELDLDVLIDKIKESKQKQKNINNCNKTENNFTNNKNQTITVSSSSDEDNLNLDEVEVEMDDIKTEISDPLTKDVSTDNDQHEDKKPEPKKKKKIDIGKQIALHRATSGAKGGKRKKQEKRDDDYQPDSTSHSEDSDLDSYDDEGKRIKKPKFNRVYPRKCDHCDYEVENLRSHYRHYLFSHPNVEYPYKLKKDYACSICGKLFTRARIFNHEAGHTTQKLKCPLCPNVYSNKNKLYSHKQQVHPKKKFTCDYCSKTFKTRNDITRHIRIHTGSKPFKCHICGDAFAHSGNRSIHIRAKHQNVKYVPKKPKRARKQKRRNNKHYSTDTEYSSDNEKTKRVTNKKTKQKCKKFRNGLEQIQV